MRNLWELLQTRFYIDKCKTAILKELRERFSWWPENVSKSVEEVVETFDAQWDALAAKEELSQASFRAVLQQTACESKQTLIAAMQKVSGSKRAPKTMPPEHKSEAEEGDQKSVDEEGLEAEGEQFLKELRTAQHIIEEQETPISLEFFFRKTGM
jgi:hypothetical protein